MSMALERIYTIPLREAYEAKRGKRGKRAIDLIRAFIARHMKADEEDISISSGVNSAVLARSIQKPPRRIKVKVVKEKAEKPKESATSSNLLTEEPAEKRSPQYGKEETEEEKKAREKLEKVAEKAERMG